MNNQRVILNLRLRQGLLIGLTVLLMGVSVSFNLSATENGQDILASQHSDHATLTLGDALKLALKHNPELAVSAKEMSALEGVKIQAGLLPNPQLKLNTEDLSSKSNSQGALLSDFRISQLIEIGGKRSARTNAASLGQARAGQDFATRRLDLMAQVANSFTNVLAGQARLSLAQESIDLARKVVDTVTKRVDAGKAPPIEETRAKVALATARITLDQTQRDLTAARKQLTLLWGNPTPKFDQVLGDLESFVDIPDFDVLAERLATNPAVLAGKINLEQRKALLVLEKARRIPDVTVNAGVRRYAHVHDTTALVGLSIPLPLFNRNQGNVLEAHHRVDQAIDEWTATDLRLKTLLAQTYEALIAAEYEINLLQNEILPGAREAFTVARRGYELGRFGFLEMLDAQRTLFQNQTLYLTALANYQRLVNEIERLIAASIEDV